MITKRSAIAVRCIVLLGLVSWIPVHQVAGQSWSGHLFAGVSSATFVGESDNEFTYRQALGGGGGVTLFVNDFLGIRSELFYAIRGAATENAIIDGQPTDLDARFSIAYVDVPVMVVLRAPLSGPVAPYASVGVAYSRNVDARITLISPLGVETTDSDSSIRSNEFALLGALGISLDVMREELFVEVRFVDGRPNIRPERPDAPLSNRSFLVVAGIRF